MERGRQARTGACLCRGVRYTITGALRPVSVCHCDMCRRASTGLGVYTACAPGDIAIEGETLSWYRSSPIARRGFCSRCGSTLFWEPTHGQHLSIGFGSLDDASDLAIDRHIFVEEDTTATRAWAQPVRSDPANGG